MPEPSPNPPSPESAGESPLSDAAFMKSIGAELTESVWSVAPEDDPDHPRLVATLNHKQSRLQIAWHGSLPAMLSVDTDDMNIMCYVVQGMLDDTFTPDMRFTAFSETDPEKQYRMAWNKPMLQDIKDAATALGVWNTEDVIHVIHKKDTDGFGAGDLLVSDLAADVSLYHDKDLTNDK